MKIINIEWNETYRLYLDACCRTDIFPMCIKGEINIFEHKGIWHIETMEYGINIDARFVEKIEVRRI